MNIFEWAAAAIGIVNVVLVARRSLWNYPFALVMVAMYFFVYFEAKLYSDALLQIFFFVINLYGWWTWLRSEKVEDGGIAVERLGNGARLLWIAGTAVAIVGWGSMMAHFTDASAPFADATVAGISVAAQILQSRRKYESWLLWVLVDALAIGLFWSRGLIATTILYSVFFFIALWGLISWHRVLKGKAA